MIIPSDTSDISDWEWIAGGFPCRDMIRERINSDNCSHQEPPIPSLDPQTNQSNIKSEILDNQPSTSDLLDCSISIISAGQSSTQHHQTTHFPSDLETKTLTAPTEPWKKVEGTNRSTSESMRLWILQTTILPLRDHVRRKSVPPVMNLN